MKQATGAVAVIGVGLVLLVTTLAAGIMSGGAQGPDGGVAGALDGGQLTGGADIPAAFRPWVNHAAALCPQESPALIAAQLWAESGFNVAAVSPAGARGPAQFMPATFSAWGRDDDGNGNASSTDIGDAVMAQGRLMCSLLATAARSGYPGGDVALALAGYNAGWQRVEQYHGVPPFPQTTAYIQRILAKTAQWTAPTGPTSVPAPASGTPGAEAVHRAQAWLGTPYVYGGGTPAGPTSGFCDGSRGMRAGSCFAATHSGFDCSSLVQHGWWPTVHLPRTAASQYQATATHTVPLTALQPGDLLFYDHGAGIDHVAMYAGDATVIQAPATGRSVETVPLYRAGFVAATRPA